MLICLDSFGSSSSDTVCRTHANEAQMPRRWQQVPIQWPCELSKALQQSVFAKLQHLSFHSLVPTGGHLTLLLAFPVMGNMHWKGATWQTPGNQEARQSAAGGSSGAAPESQEGPYISLGI